ncbi:IclR family transcriptional regulator [Kibdelosporangium philippinense]|uniref:IclR family transcriptional regulator n=1 Tax=Kibdelosporangium philippinense TaxID=211113 RepID=A0ABS8Z3N3_9PSEU|nr:IclR family transcriptional regulator [Kibdelosporangium philippinense]MCE7001618.1 IclR family transcriptional regulator [Kibdelosporangium philippinense]
MKPATGEPVVDRVFRILSSFERHETGLSLTSLSAQAGLPKSTTLRLIRRLVEWGALERAEDGTYAIGLRLFEIAALAPRGHGLRAVALPYMDDLLRETGHHVLLAVRDGSEAVAVERLSAHGAVHVAYRIGGRMPLPQTGVGLVLLAYAPAEVQEALFAREATVDLRRLTAKIRREGVALNKRMGSDPTASIAAPIVGSREEVVAAVSVIVPVGSLCTSAMRPAVASAARAIGREIQRTRN